MKNDLYLKQEQADGRNKEVVLRSRELYRQDALTAALDVDYYQDLIRARIAMFNPGFSSDRLVGAATFLVPPSLYYDLFQADVYSSTGFYRVLRYDGTMGPVLVSGDMVTEDFDASTSYKFFALTPCTAEGDVIVDFNPSINYLSVIIYAASGALCDLSNCDCPDRGLSLNTKGGILYRTVQVANAWMMLDDQIVQFPSGTTGYVQLTAPNAELIDGNGLMIPPTESFSSVTSYGTYYTLTNGFIAIIAPLLTTDAVYHLIDTLGGVDGEGSSVIRLAPGAFFDYFKGGIVDGVRYTAQNVLDLALSKRFTIAVF